MYSHRNSIFLIFLSTFLPNPVYPHGRLMDPPMRASLWRFAEFEEYFLTDSTETEDTDKYNDDSFWCGGMTTQYQQNGGKCGVCGDNYADEVPRAQEDFGKYGKGIIARNYTVGQIIPLKVELTKAHSGYFEFRLCPRNSRLEPETQECYDSHILTLENNSTQLPISFQSGMYETFAKLPDSVICSRCSIQWHYRTGNNWGDCGNRTFEVSCGPQETFRGCADVAIMP